MGYFLKKGVYKIVKDALASFLRYYLSDGEHDLADIVELNGS